VGVNPVGVPDFPFSVARPARQSLGEALAPDVVGSVPRHPPVWPPKTFAACASFSPGKRINPRRPHRLPLPRPANLSDPITPIPRWMSCLGQLRKFPFTFFRK